MTTLDHCNIRTFDLDSTVGFYTDIVDLKLGDFYGSPGTGAWLYDASARPILHLIAIDPKDPETVLQKVRERLGDLAGPLERSTLSGGGAIDHVAFECQDYEAMMAKLAARGCKFTTNDVARINLRQIFVNDPNGVTLELNFR